MKVAIVVLVLAACVSLGASYPLHASCKLTWSFGVNCTVVHDKLIAQIKKWTNDPSDCGSSEKCDYMLGSDTAAKITAKHQTPVKHYMDDLTFSLSGGTSDCTVDGFSTSETWYAVLDSGTNYCNLRNLADGSGLSMAKGFKEDTSDSICTQFSSKNCDKY